MQGLLPRKVCIAVDNSPFSCSLVRWALERIVRTDSDDLHIIAVADANVMPSFAVCTSHLCHSALHSKLHCRGVLANETSSICACSSSQGKTLLLAVRRAVMNAPPRARRLA